MLTQPMFASAFHVEVGANNILLSSNGEYAVLDSPICLAITPYLTGENTVEHIVSALSDQYRSEDIYYVLLLMEQDGYLVEAGITENDSLLSFWHSMDVHGIDVAERLEERPVSLSHLGIDHIDGIYPILNELGVQVNPDSEYEVILTDDYLSPEIEEINRKAYVRCSSFFLINPYVPLLWLGPVLSPGQSGCWECLTHRLQLNRPADVFLEELGKKNPKEYQKKLPETLLNTGLNLAAVEIGKWLLSDIPETYAPHITSIDLKTLESNKHAFVRRPQCRLCGNPDMLKPAPLQLNKSHRLNREQGFRIFSSQKTTSFFEHHVSPYTGIIRSVSPVEITENRVIHNYTAGHSGRINGHSIESLRFQTRDQSGGKGKTNTQAKTSALCEALERFSAVYDNEPSNCTASYASLKGKAIHPESILLFSDEQYGHRELWNTNLSGYFHFIPERLKEEEIAWTEVWSLTSNEPCLIPTAYCYYGYTGPGSTFCRADSNGLAAGNCIEEAILYGFLELAERDAVSMWWYNRTRHPGVDLNSLQDPYVESVQSFYDSLDRDIWVLDITNDLQVPTFVAISKKRSNTQDILLGFGAHFDAHTAITRSLLEINQSLPSVLRADEDREKHLLPDFKDILDWWNTATIENQPYLLPSETEVIRSSRSYEAFDVLVPAKQIELYVDRLNALGLVFLALDMTKPDIGLSVARVIVPGLRHFWRRLAPGRLYDIPVELRLLEATKGEHELNPISLFL